MSKKIIVFLILSIVVGNLNAQLYKDSTANIDARVEDLLKRMTPEEKFWQCFMIPGNPNDGPERYKDGIFGIQVNTVQANNGNVANQMLNYEHKGTAYDNTVYINSLQKGIIQNTRLGIPIIPFDEGLHGLVRSGATSFPQSIALAATWDTELMSRVATAIAFEFKSRGIRMTLSPMINIADDVRWGRIEETYGEDPFLSSMMAVAYISAFEKNGIITCPKHLIANVGAGGRDSYPIKFNERFLREIEFPPYDACIKNGTRSVMTSYNTLDGTPCSANDWMLNKLLKDEWKFPGFVISDAGAVGGANVLHFTTKNYPESSADAMINGLDVIFQTNFDHYKLFIPPFLDGRIPQSRIDDAVRRVLKAKFQLGLFEHPYADPEEAKRQNQSEEHKKIALEAAQKSIVLLQNNQHTLPLSTNFKKIAVIGPDAVEARLGGYSGPGNPISILTGIQKKMNGKGEVYYAEAMTREVKLYSPVPDSCFFHEENNILKSGIKAEFFNTMNCSGNPALVRTDLKIQYQWTLFSPDQSKINYDFFSARLTGKIKSPKTGKFQIGIDGNDGYKLYINGKLVLDNSLKMSRKEIKTVEYQFEAGKLYDLKIEYNESAGNAWFTLIWNQGINNNYEQKLLEAEKIAAKSDVIVVVAGIEEGEFRDRALLNLPGNQEECILRMAKLGKPIVVVLVGGGAITMKNWMDSVNAIVDVWYGGDMGGIATTNVLFGDYNPAGRLPITFPVHEGQVPLTYNHKPTGRGDDYMNLTGQALFPFGFGLSYSEFEYSNLQFKKKTIRLNESTTCTFTLKNISKLDGDEVVQLYIRDEYSSVARPLTELKAFQRIHLKAGESKEITFEITPEMLSMLNKDLRKVVEAGDFRIMIGASCKDIKLREVITAEEK